MTRLVAAFGLMLVLTGFAQTAYAGACTNKACTCDSDCMGLKCSSDPDFSPGFCCGLPVMMGKPCAGTGAGGAGGATGDAAAVDAGGGGGGGGGCSVAAADLPVGAALGALGVALAVVTVARRGSSRRRPSRRSNP